MRFRRIARLLLLNWRGWRTAAEVNKSLKSQNDVDLIVYTSDIKPRYMGFPRFKIENGKVVSGTSGLTTGIFQEDDLFAPGSNMARVTQRSDGLNYYPEMWKVSAKNLDDDRGTVLIKIQDDFFEEINVAIIDKDLETIEKLIVRSSLTVVHEGYGHAKKYFEGKESSELMDHASFFGISVENYTKKFGNSSPSIEEIKSLNPNSPASQALGEIEEKVKELKPEIERLISDSE
jgi:hypothetical protein